MIIFRFKQSISYTEKQVEKQQLDRYLYRSIGKRLERQIDRQIDIQIDRYREINRNRQRLKAINRDRQRDINRTRDKQIEIQIDRQIDRQINVYTWRRKISIMIFINIMFLRTILRDNLAKNVLFFFIVISYLYLLIHQIKKHHICVYKKSELRSLNKRRAIQNIYAEYIC